MDNTLNYFKCEKALSVHFNWKVAELPGTSALELECTRANSVIIVVLYAKVFCIFVMSTQLYTTFLHSVENRCVKQTLMFCDMISHFYKFLRYFYKQRMLELVFYLSVSWSISTIPHTLISHAHFKLIIS